MNNPHSADPRYALAPFPRGVAGHRLWSFLHRRRPDVMRIHYMQAFDRRNLCAGGWSRREAREVFEAMRPALEGRTVLLLGEEVRLATGVPRELVLPQVLGGVTYRQLPHPSGLCRWYNDEANRELAALLLEEMYEEGRRTT
jgi:hypothetical protein